MTESSEIDNLRKSVDDAENETGQREQGTEVAWLVTWLVMLVSFSTYDVFLFSF